MSDEKPPDPLLERFRDIIESDPEASEQLQERMDLLDEVAEMDGYVVAQVGLGLAQRCEPKLYAAATDGPTTETVNVCAQLQYTLILLAKKLLADNPKRRIVTEGSIH